VIAALVVAIGVVPALPLDSPRVEKTVIVSIGSDMLKGGMVTEIMWDGGLLLIQGVFAEPSGQLKADYFAVPADGVELKPLPEPTDAAIKYWEMKANRLSPTGLGRIASSTDAKMPMYGVGSLDKRLRDAHEMGGMETHHILRLGDLILLERVGGEPPYDGETYSWSPPELNRLAYVDGKGDLWVVGADGRRPTRLLRGEFTLPAWSEDGRTLAIAERKDNGRRWEISLVHLPEEWLRSSSPH
jgi:hypothetical protein